jgi:hypothetical protein
MQLGRWHVGLRESLSNTGTIFYLRHREIFWDSMQTQWENTLNATNCLVITGDDIPRGESAIVISVSDTQYRRKIADCRTIWLIRIIT